MTPPSGKEPEHVGSPVGGTQLELTPKAFVSVIIPTHNRASMIVRAVRSALAQTHSDLEVLVVDDASTDDTATRVASIDDPRVRYFKQPTNLGACAARNFGIREAAGEYVAFLDSDDEWFPHKLERQLEVLGRTELPAVGIVTCGEVGLRGEAESSRWLPDRRGWLFEDLLEQRSIGCRTSNLLVRRGVLIENGIGFDPVLPARQDWDFVTQVARFAQLDICREHLVMVHHHEGERVWTATRAIEAARYLHDKFQSDLRRRPRAHNRFHLRTALTCLSVGDTKEARREVREALRAWPTSPLTYLWFLVALLSPAGKLSLASRAGLKVLRSLTF